jgi:endonuclease-3
MTRARSRRILRLLKEFHGTPRPDLSYRDTYQLAVAVVLSAQTTDAQVNTVTKRLFDRYPDFPSLARASRAAVEKIIRSTGFYHNKARHIIGLAGAVTKKFEGRLPQTMEELLTLPGIGRKSANVILGMGFLIPAFAVDTHVRRIANRLGYSGSPDPVKVEKALTAMIPRGEWITGHLLFITHGRKICTARSPRHEECPVSALCDFVKNNP